MRTIESYSAWGAAYRHCRGQPQLVDAATADESLAKAQAKG
jgi:hypothetical protein